MESGLLVGTGAWRHRTGSCVCFTCCQGVQRTHQRHVQCREWLHDEPARRRDQPLPAAARRQPGRLVGVGGRRRSRRRGGATCRCCSRSATPPATGATSWPTSRSRTRGGRGASTRASSRSRSTARSGPTSTRSTWPPPRRMTGHGGWPMTASSRPDAEPFFAGTYLPGRSSCAAGRRDRRLDGPPRGRARQRCQRRRNSCAPSPRRRRPPPSATTCSTRRSPRWRAGSTRATADSVSRPSSRRRWCWSSCCATTPAGQGRPLAADGRRHL